MKSENLAKYFFADCIFLTAAIDSTKVEIPCLQIVIVRIFYIDARI